MVRKQYQEASFKQGRTSASLIMTAAAIMDISDAGVYRNALPDALRFACCLTFSFFGGLLPASLMGYDHCVHAKSRIASPSHAQQEQFLSRIASVSTVVVLLPTRREHKWTGLTEPMMLVGGAIEVPVAPGMGIDVDETKIEKYRVHA